jgi:hypothetical protein
MNSLEEEANRATGEYVQAKRMYYGALEAWENAKEEWAKLSDTKNMIYGDSSTEVAIKKQALDEIEHAIQFAILRADNCGADAQHTHDAMELPRQRMINAIAAAGFPSHLMDRDKFKF